MGLLLFLLTLAVATGYEYVRLSDADRALHFEEFSVRDVKEIKVADDKRFWNAEPLGVSENYSMMSWVQIQEFPGRMASIWRIYHDDKQVPALVMKPEDGHFQGRASTTDDVNLQFEVDIADLEPLPALPIWRHVTIIVWGSAFSPYARIWVTLWNGSVTCGEKYLDAGTVITLDSSSIVQIGASPGFKTAKQQILDLRYYYDTWLSEVEIDSIVTSVSGCSVTCSAGCWGPGNYSCNDFITLIDPLVGYILDATASGYKSWAGDDSFLQARTYDSTNVALTGWFGEFSNTGIFPTYLRVNTEEWECWDSPGCRVGALTRDPIDAYRYCHYNTAILGNDCVSVPFAGFAVNNWRFVTGSTCDDDNTLYVCYGNVTGGVTCEDEINPEPFEKFETDGAWSHIMVGSPWEGQSNMEVRDARYYYSKCLNTTEMDSIKSYMMCEELCETCASPDTCTTWVDGFVLSNNVCVACECPCRTCYSDTTTCSSCYEGTYLYSDDCVDSWLEYRYWPDDANRICQSWHDCCIKCTGSSNEEWVAGTGWGISDGDDCYAMPDAYGNPDDTHCSSNCPDGYYGDSTIARHCLPWDDKWKTCNGQDNTYCYSCNENINNSDEPYLQQPTAWDVEVQNVVCYSGTCLDDFCPDGYWKNFSQKEWWLCDFTCGNCFAGDEFSCDDSCAEGFYLQLADPICVNASNRCICEFDSCPHDYYYKNEVNNWCDPCHKNWKECSGATNEDCYVCNPTYILQPYPNVTTCLKGWPAADWNDADSNGFWLDPIPEIWKMCDKACGECEGPAQNQCTKCKDGYYIQPSPNQTTCDSSCPTTHYGNSTTRVWDLWHSSGSCLTCDGPTQYDCTYCITNFYLQPSGTCLEDQCPTGYYKDSSDLTCKEWYLQCADCDIAGNADAWNCTACPTGLQLRKNGTCYSTCGWWEFGNAAFICELWDPACPSCTTTDYSYACNSWTETTCAVICPGSYYFTHYTNYNWYSCHWMCSTCTEQASNTKCITCATGYIFDTGTTDTCINPCPDGQYPTDSASTCGNCPTGWKVCQGTDCYTCSATYYMQRTSDACDTICPDGQYPQDSDMTCQLCHAACETCMGPTEEDWILCTSSPEHCRYDVNPKCLGKYSGEYWPSGFYCNASLLTCDPCHADCPECYGPDNDNWSSCNSPLYRQYSPHVCDATPPPSEDWFVDGLRRILPCNAAWNQCWGQQIIKCSEWNSGWFLDGSTCVEDCPEGYWNDVLTCTACDSACAICADGTRDNWSECNAPYFLQGTTWTIICIDDTYYNSIIDRCLPCHIFCATCTDSTRNSCSECRSGSPPDFEKTFDAFLEGSAWVVLCTAGYYGEMSTHTCEPCHESWMVCDQTTEYDCTNWFRFTYLHTDGSWQCFNRFFPVYGPFDCEPCNKRCNLCTGPATTDCTSCEFKADLYVDGSCGCEEGYYDNTFGDPNSNLKCKSCNSSCYLWDNRGSTSCLSWKTHASLTPVAGGPAGSCSCDDGYYDEDDGSVNWALCNSQCVLCSSEGSSGWDTCSTDHSTVANPPGSCTCIDGYFDTGLLTLLDCQPCQAPWVLCVGLADTDCYTCVDPNAYVETPPGACACRSGFYDAQFGISPIDCQPCHSNCATWAGPAETEWYTCAQAGAVNNDAPLTGKCTWKATAYDANDGVPPLHWIPCYPDCERWEGGTYQDWTHWSDVNTSLETLPVSAWVCNDYFVNLNFGPPNDCQPCHLHCKSCSGTELWDCLTCEATNAWVKHGAPGRCFCEDGFYDDNLGVGQLNWQTWHPYWKTCVDGNTERDCILCTADYAQADEPKGECFCYEYYFDANFESGALDCQPWHSRCETCGTTESDGCITCMNANSHILHEDTIGEWLCNDGLFESENPYDCVWCHPECATCMGRESYHCLTWHGNTIEVKNAPAGCVCTTGMYDAAWELGIIDWEDCHPEWLECNGPTEVECTQCILKKLLIDGVCTDQEQCPDGYYQIRNNWLHWQSNWITCEHSSTNCLSWNTPKYEITPDCLVKTCPSQQFLRQADWTCQLCSEGCLECNHEYECTRCFPTFVRADGFCSCLEGFKSSQHECVEIWGDGMNWGQSECDDGNVADYDGWTPLCQVMRRWHCSGNRPDVCTNELNDYTPPEWILSVSDNNDLILLFSEPVQGVEYKNLDTPIESVQYSNLSVFIENVQFTWDITALNSQKYEIKLNFKESINKGTIVRVTLTNNITDLVGIPSRDPSQTVALEREEIFYDEMSYAITAVKVGVIYSLAFTCCCGNLRRFWVLFNSLQLVILLTMINVNAPEILYNFVVGVQDFELPQFYDLFVDEDYFLDHIPPTEAIQNFGYDSTVFLANANDEILMWCQVMLIYPIYRLLATCRKKIWYEWAVKKSQDYVWSFQHRTFIELYLETGVHALLQLETATFANWPIGVSSAIALAFVAAMFIYPVWISVGIYRWYDELYAGDTPFKLNDIHGTIYLEMAPKQNLNAYLYYFFFLMRRLVYAFTLALLYEYPRLQIGLTWAHSILFLVWFIYTKPFEDKVQTWMTIATEQATFVLLTEYTLFLWTEDVDTRYYIAWYYIYTTLFIIAANSIAMTVFEWLSYCNCWNEEDQNTERAQLVQSKVNSHPNPFGSNHNTDLSRTGSFDRLRSTKSNFSPSPSPPLSPEHRPKKKRKSSKVAYKTIKSSHEHNLSNKRAQDIIPTRMSIEEDIIVEDIGEEIEEPPIMPRKLSEDTDEEISQPSIIPIEPSEESDEEIEEPPIILRKPLKPYIITYKRIFGQLEEIVETDSQI